MGPILALFVLTVRQTLLTRKVWITLLLLAAPSALMLLIRNVAPPIRQAEPLWEQYHVPVLFLITMVVMPVVCMLHGAGLISSDVESRTFVYLTTRRMRRGTVLAVKFVATALALIVLCDLSVICFHLCSLTGRNVPETIAQSSLYADWSPVHDLLAYLAIIPAGVVGYLAVFTLIGLLTARPLAASALYLITVELVMANIPAGARVYSLSHQVRATLVDAIPLLRRLFQDELSAELFEKLFPKGATGLPELLGVVLITLVLSGTLVTIRELLPTKVARE